LYKIWKPPSSPLGIQPSATIGKIRPYQCDD
jgi:hypothetical protein